MQRLGQQQCRELQHKRLLFHTPSRVSCFSELLKHGNIKETKCQDPDSDRSWYKPCSHCQSHDEQSVQPLKQRTKHRPAIQGTKISSPLKRDRNPVLTDLHSHRQSKQRTRVQVITLHAQIKLMTDTSS